MACLVHTGLIASLGQAHAKLYAWMEANRRKPAGPPRELYLRDTSEDSPIDQVVVVQLPVEPLFPFAPELTQNVKENPNDSSPDSVFYIYVPVK